MEPWLLAVIIIAGIILAVFLFGILPFFIVAIHVTHKQLTRKSKDEWGRACSAPDNQEQVAMYEIGEKWFSENKDHATDVEITSYDGLHLIGQYFDFGSNKCAIIHQGRTESLLYTHYFAKPYKDAGFNILVIDPRAHGLSDGKHSTVGLKESRDLLQWTELVHDRFHNEKIIYQGICIGSATCLYAITDKKCPSYVEGIVVDGMYKSFHSTMTTHMKAEGAPIASFLAFLVNLVILMENHVNPITRTPKHEIRKLTKPILMIHSKMDIFSLPKYADELYEICPSDKEIAWFDKGGHSHIRINNQEKYDEVIKAFIEKKSL